VRLLQSFQLLLAASFERDSRVQAERCEARSILASKYEFARDSQKAALRVHGCNTAGGEALSILKSKHEINKAARRDCVAVGLTTAPLDALQKNSKEREDAF
jgi:hypothetical protein